VSALAGLLTTVTVATLVKEMAHPLLAQMVGIAAGATLNFGLNFFWTWRR
jgi:putative flippase GtrA